MKNIWASAAFAAALWLGACGPTQIPMAEEDAIVARIVAACAITPTLLSVRTVIESVTGSYKVIDLPGYYIRAIIAEVCSAAPVSAAMRRSLPQLGVQPPVTIGTTRTYHITIYGWGVN